MRNRLLLIFGMLLVLFIGCATPGPKTIDITYLSDHKKTQSGHIGIASFEDKRKDMDKGYIGYRTLINNSQETYFVKGLDLADTLTKIMGVYFEKNGFSIRSINPWDLTPDGVVNASNGFNQIIAGDINTFECRAKKNGATTDMILNIDLTLYLGLTNKKALKTIPVSLTLERTEFTFTPKKLEQFVNQSIEDVIKKALIF
ncbi:MAG: hypothetical protein GY699_11880 [Desulfobacteraceae bacterium]|nr:hypothetical protein [Desulfobacteraceae bacterium]